MKRVLALDIGTVRIGVAVSDPTMSFANGIATLDASSDWIEALRELVKSYSADAIVIGMPRRTDGTYGVEAESIRKHEARVKEVLPEMDIIEWDERFTTKIATTFLLEGNVSRKKRKQVVDKTAAALILQSYLDSIRRGND